MKSLLVAKGGDGTLSVVQSLITDSSPHGIAFAPSDGRAFVTDHGGSMVLVIEVGAKPNGILWLDHD